MKDEILAYETWVNTPAAKDITIVDCGLMLNKLSDLHGMKILGNLSLGFISSPIVNYLDHTFIIDTVVFTDFKSMQHFLEDKKILLYRLHWEPSFPIYMELDEKTSLPVFIKTGPVISPGKWILKFVDVNKKDN